MREIDVGLVTEKVAAMVQKANFELNQDVRDAFQRGLEIEESPTGKAVLDVLVQNADAAKDEKIGMCQDTGVAVFFVELGQDVRLAGDLTEAINEGVRQGYQEGYLRKSMCDPFTRKNTGDNTPAIIHFKLVPGDALKIDVAPKGGGSENMSRVMMLKPSDGREGIKQYVINRVIESGPNPCPPTVVGVGIGGNFEQSAILSKKALFRPLGQPNADPDLAALEAEILEAVNNSGIGPAGLGGRVTSMAVHVEYMPCHIASLPLAVNINCHASRHQSVTL